MSWSNYPYEGSVIMVTGGGTGIGRAVARGFLQQGATVVVVGRTAHTLEETLEGQDAARALAIVADITSRAAVETAVATVLDRFARLDVVVASAGTSEASAIEDFEDEAWERMRSVNLDAFITLTRATVPALKSSHGNLVAISSIAGMGGDWKQFAYNATKGAVNAMVQSLALDLGAEGVRVNAVAPGFTASALTQDRLDDPDFAERLMDRIALRRVATPEDIANCVLFIASPDAGYITGAIIPVDGGTTASCGTPRPV